jgi:hypothetical protein
VSGQSLSERHASTGDGFLLFELYFDLGRMGGILTKGADEFGTLHEFRIISDDGGGFLWSRLHGRQNSRSR